MVFYHIKLDSENRRKNRVKEHHEITSRGKLEVFMICGNLKHTISTMFSYREMTTVTLIKSGILRAIKTAVKMKQQKNTYPSSQPSKPKHLTTTIKTKLYLII